MKLIRMTSGEQEELLAKLAGMPDFLDQAFGGISGTDALAPGPEGTFSPVEHCWHLADLEREGYAERIRRLLAETDPVLPDFDGARVARERNYRTLALADGLRAFRVARAANLNALRSVAGSDWMRSGAQDGVGVVALCDVPLMMAEHDAGHRHEIQAWLAARRPASPA
jgi:DinB family protein